jgi:hypothetical protein
MCQDGVGAAQSEVCSQARSLVREREFRKKRGKRAQEKKGKEKRERRRVEKGKPCRSEGYQRRGGLWKDHGGRERRGPRSLPSCASLSHTSPFPRIWDSTRASLGKRVMKWAKEKEKEKKRKRKRKRKKETLWMRGKEITNKFSI